jgi:predicted regulator of Ras-like GTPase activity (Roadblock/LC7/MglB family)
MLAAAPGQIGYEGMTIASATWTLTHEDENALGQVLQRLVQESGARCALLVDRSGQLVTLAGERPRFDTTAFATLTAADFSANDQLARLLGESDFNTLYHQGEREAMLLADVARRAILVILFDNRTTLGLVRLRSRTAVAELGPILEGVLGRDSTAAPRPGILAGAEDDIDKLFQ